MGTSECTKVNVRVELSVGEASGEPGGGHVGHRDHADDLDRPSAAPASGGSQHGQAVGAQHYGQHCRRRRTVISHLHPLEDQQLRFGAPDESRVYDEELTWGQRPTAQRTGFGVEQGVPLIGDELVLRSRRLPADFTTSVAASLDAAGC